ncbi:thymidylate synthase [Actinomyces timonensis]|uniref:thymidylate synthase n=1 Tax=Actinomyces timonensis TaxID=1288391 RepID=UPI0002F5002D|nr:thymidylate synthase [Actinomyces timonensis]
MSATPALESMGLAAPDGVDVAYEELLADILLHGTPKGDRTGTGTRSLFARQLRYDLSRGFPRITTKFVAMKAVKGELLWFLKGSTNIGWLTEHGITIWDEWADADGGLGPVYGAQWRSWPARDGGAIDQISALIHTLRTDPDSRRMLVSAWNVSELDRMALAPCHAFFQCYVAGGRLSLQVYQRSADMFLGVPFNIASYALLTHMLAQQAGLEPGELVWTGGDCHIYSNHVEQVREQLSRVPRAYPFPTLRLERAESIDAYTMEGIDASQGYQHHPSIKAPVAV